MTLDSVVQRDYLICGISEGSPGFAHADADGRWSGFDVDYCRAIAAAIFGKADKVRFRPIGPKEGLTALATKEIDILSRSVSWTAHLEADLGLRFVGVSFFSGQGLMVRRELGVASALELSGTKVCVGPLPDVETNIVDYFTSRDMTFEIAPHERDEDAIASYAGGKCDVYTADIAYLTVAHAAMTPPEDHVILVDALSKEPLGPVIRKGDDQWFDISRWTLNAMIAAEELGVTSTNVEALVNSGNTAVKHLLGIEGTIGQQLGLQTSWARAVISEVGNYAEVFERNLGVASGLGLERGRNRLWSSGGLIYAPMLF